jgi:hypothetical protein
MWRAALTPKDHDPQQWALAVIDEGEACGHALTPDELEIIFKQTKLPYLLRRWWRKSAIPENEDE